MRRNWLITALFFTLTALVVSKVWSQVIHPRLTQAQPAPAGSNEVGPHVAFFDRGNNILIPQMVKEKTPKNLPITVMVDINETKEGIDLIYSATSGLSPIFRVVGIDVNTQTQAIVTLANAFKESTLPAGTIVVFGNELNNLDKEWKSCSAACPGQEGAAGGAYGAKFRLFQGPLNGRGLIVVPAPPDMYNSVYAWQPFVQQAGVYTGSLVANVYELPEGGGAGLDLWQQLPGNVIAFTEYGPHPSKSLREHIDFFANNSPAKPATTLIPDKCTDPPEVDKFIYYIDGNIYDKDGNRLDPDDCEVEDIDVPDSVYKRFVYPFISGDEQVMMDQLKEDYDVSCVPKAEYEGVANGDLQKLFQYGGCTGENLLNNEFCKFEAAGSLNITSAGAAKIFGTLRSEIAAKSRALNASKTENAGKRSFTNRFESVEQWFGGLNPSEDRYSNTTPVEIRETHQGPFYKLASAEMQCTASAEILKAIRNLCAEWDARKPADEEGECPLINRAVPGVSAGHGVAMTYGTLMRQIENFEGGISKDYHRYGLFCERYFNTKVENRDATVRAGYNMERLYENLTHVELYMETAYRPAFLVMVTQSDEDKPPFGIDNPNQRVVGIRNTGEKNDATRHFVDYLVYHVPATLTDTDQGQEYKDNPADYSDVIKKTAMTIASQEFTEYFQGQVEDYEKTLARAFESEEEAPSQAPPIQCYEPECDEPLRKTLIKYLNVVVGRSLNFKYDKEPNFDMACDTFPDEYSTSTSDVIEYEQGNKIGSQLAPNDSFSDLENAKKEPEPGSGIGSQEIDTAEADVQLKQFIGVNDTYGKRSRQPRTIMYNISPHRANTEYVATVMDSLFAVEQQEKNFNYDKGYYDKFRALLGWSNESPPGTEYTYAGQVVDEFGVPQFEDDNITPKMESGKVYGTVNLKEYENRQEFAVKFEWMAKIFNRSTRAIVQNIFGEGTSILQCARDLKNPNTNTEDFLLNCQNKGAGVPGGTDPAIDDYMNTPVAVKKDNCQGFTPGNKIPIQRSTTLCKEPNSVSGEIEFEALFTPAINISDWRNGNDGGSTAEICTQAFYDSVGCTYSPDGTGKTPYVNLVAHKVNDVGVFASNGSMTACEFVVNKAREAGVSPRLALAMWGEESNFGAFASPTGGEDFGVISQPSSREVGNIFPQLDAFLKTVTSYTQYPTFLRRYSGEKDFTPQERFCNNPQFPYRLKDFYDNVSIF